jgi:hypothetical protein
VSPHPRLPPALLALLLTALLASPGCFYKVGSGLMAGVLDEAGGKGQSEGFDPVVEGLVEKALLAELGQQLGQGLQAGVTEVTPEQQARLEATIDGLITVATARAGKGLRRDVSPELRAMVQRDIVEAFSDGMRGELGGSLEETVDRLVTRAILSLRTGLEDDEMKYATADFLRESVYLALREGDETPPVGETVQATLEQNVLDPFSSNVENLAETIASKVNEQAERTQNFLQAIISLLVVVLGVFAVMYFVLQRRYRREQADRAMREHEMQNLNVALAQLDAGTREQVESKLSEVRSLVDGPKGAGAPTAPGAPPRAEDTDETERSEDYER